MLQEEYETEITSRNRVSTSSDLYTERRQNIKDENAESRRNQFLRQRSHSYAKGLKYFIKKILLIYIKIGVRVILNNNDTF